MAMSEVEHKKLEDENDFHLNIDQMEENSSCPGIIYLSSVPTNMNVKKIREVFTSYGDVGRIFLEPDEKALKHKKNLTFKEGWVEFLDKKVAKHVARQLNCTQVGGKRRSPWYEELWNIKYLKKFLWSHLNERQAYERAIHKKRMRHEISQAKKITNNFVDGVRGKHKRKEFETSTDNEKYTADDDVSKKKIKNDDKNFLTTLFSGGLCN